uniref:Uncharacterized protein n=1 Tax=Arundo donax TaxID=35708 RepID=A0A0A9F598_ARUDO
MAFFCFHTFANCTCLLIYFRSFILYPKPRSSQHIFLH